MLINDSTIVAARPAKNRVDPRRPYAYLCEPEYSAAGIVEQVATLFLTNKECPFRCLMCDLWKNTLDESIAPGDILAQIDFALKRLPEANSIKLYNSSNFFDRKAIPRSDYAAIASRMESFERVIVENHPSLCNTECVRFKDMLAGRLEVAMGLETVHPPTLERLNKRMTLDDFERATHFLLSHYIDVRAFILLRPPYMTEEEGIEWAIRSMEFAFSIGISCCSIIPTRSGNGILDQLVDSGEFESPTIESMERTHEAGLTMNHGRVFMDLWDVERFYTCASCGPARSERIQQMNLTQRIPDTVRCLCAQK